MRSKNNEYFVLIEGFVDTYMDSHGISPSTREIATGTGLSTATVSRYMSYMCNFPPHNRRQVHMGGWQARYTVQSFSL